MAVDLRPRVYADADVFLNVLLDQEHAAICSSLLEAAKRGDIRFVASRLLLVEVGGWGGDRPGHKPAADLIEEFLDSTDTEWVELDVIAAREAQRIGWEHKLRAGDAVHLATALRRNVDYFMSYDNRFPYGSTLGQTAVTKPCIVWRPTLEDGLQ